MTGARVLILRIRSTNNMEHGRNGKLTIVVIRRSSLLCERYGASLESKLKFSQLYLEHDFSLKIKDNGWFARDSLLVYSFCGGPQSTPGSPSSHSLLWSCSRTYSRELNPNLSTSLSMTWTYFLGSTRWLLTKVPLAEPRSRTYGVTLRPEE